MVKSRSGSSDVDSSTYVPMIGCFVAGFVTNRLLNHQNVVTGELEEGLDEELDEDNTQLYVLLGIVIFFFAGVCWHKLTKKKANDSAG